MIPRCRRPQWSINTLLLDSHSWFKHDDLCNHGRGMSCDFGRGGTSHAIGMDVSNSSLSEAFQAGGLALLSEPSSLDAGRRNSRYPMSASGFEEN
jgi:hypothetical protein